MRPPHDPLSAEAGDAPHHRTASSLAKGLACGVAGLLSRLPSQLGRALVMVYRYTLSPYIGMHCRYVPTCSQYSYDALGRFGLWAGGWMTLARLLRCHPGGSSGLDLVPDTLPPNARWFLPWRYGLWRGVNDPGHDKPSNCCGG